MKNNEKLRKEINDILIGMGMPTNIRGYRYCIEAILMFIKNQTNEKGITVKVYPELSDKFENTVSGIERNIRYAIEYTYKKGNPDFLKKHFGLDIPIVTSTGRPTNASFISFIATQLVLQNSEPNEIKPKFLNDLNNLNDEIFEKLSRLEERVSILEKFISNKVRENKEEI
ncbi:MAG: sporulation initiation factor Spo0A C-terminal domain-containing protein [Defluviitaleaceae bacterium]|nr:sporulation initiation factor Spo0A C-terminal domain-containing protein [Defluviitaleaceae bacterium]